MYGKKIVEPARGPLASLARMDYWFMAILGVIAVGIFLAIMWKK